MTASTSVQPLTLAAPALLVHPSNASKGGAGLPCNSATLEARRAGIGEAADGPSMRLGPVRGLLARGPWGRNMHTIRELPLPAGMNTGSRTHTGSSTLVPQREFKLTRIISLMSSGMRLPLAHAALRRQGHGRAVVVGKRRLRAHGSVHINRLTDLCVLGSVLSALALKTNVDACVRNSWSDEWSPPPDFPRQRHGGARSLGPVRRKRGSLAARSAPRMRRAMGSRLVAEVRRGTPLSNWWKSLVPRTSSLVTLSLIAPSRQ